MRDDAIAELKQKLRGTVIDRSDPKSRSAASRAPGGVTAS